MDGWPSGRPWHEQCRSSRKDDYLHYKALSPWKDLPLYPARKLKSPKGFRKKCNFWLIPLNTAINKAGGTPLLVGQSYKYWSSTEKVSGTSSYYVTFNDNGKMGTAFGMQNSNSYKYLVRACFVF